MGICAVAARDEVMSAKYVEEAGYITKKKDPWTLNRVACIHWGEYSAYSLGVPNDGKLGGIMKAADNIAILDPILQFYEPSGDVFIAARGCICTRITAQSFGFFEVNTAFQIQMAAREALKARGIEAGVVANRTLPSSAEPDWS